MNNLDTPALQALSLDQLENRAESLIQQVLASASLYRCNREELEDVLRRLVADRTNDVKIIREIWRLLDGIGSERDRLAQYELICVQLSITVWPLQQKRAETLVA